MGLDSANTSMAATFSNDTILNQLRSGTAQFELVSSPLKPNSSLSVIHNTNSRFFARIGLPLGTPSSFNKKVERYGVHKITGDGRCMFRALVKGMARNKGITLTQGQERNEADELRTAVKEVICGNSEERQQYQEAIVAITVDEPLKRYCQRIGQSDFWGGESELLVLSKLCRQPIIVYIPENEHKHSTRGSGFIPIAEYGAEHRKVSGKGKAREAVKLLYSGSNHYDLLVCLDSMP